MENLRKRVDIKVVRTCGNPKEKEQIRKIIAKPNYDRVVIFSEELSALHSHKTRLKLNKPVYVGMCVLDLSKHLMYDWYYNTLKRKYGSQCTLLYTDTDSLLVDLKNPRCICRHGIHENPLRLLRLPKGPPALQRAKQEDHRQVQR